MIWTNIMDFGIKCIWMPKGCAYITSIKSTEYIEPRNQGAMMGYPISEICDEFLHIFNRCHYYWREQLESLFMVQILHSNLSNEAKSKANQLKGDPYIGWCESSIGNTWAPVKEICIIDYCKTIACSIGVIPWMNSLLLCTDMSNYWSLGTTMCKMWILSWGNWSIAKGNLEAKFKKLIPV